VSLTVEVGYGEMLSSLSAHSKHSDIYILISSKLSHLTVVSNHSFQLQAGLLLGTSLCQNHKQLPSSKISYQYAMQRLEATPPALRLRAMRRVRLRDFSDFWWTVTTRQLWIAM